MQVWVSGWPVESMNWIRMNESMNWIRMNERIYGLMGRLMNEWTNELISQWINNK